MKYGTKFAGPAAREIAISIFKERGLTEDPDTLFKWVIGERPWATPEHHRKVLDARNAAMYRLNKVEGYSSTGVARLFNLHASSSVSYACNMHEASLGTMRAEAWLARKREISMKANRKQEAKRRNTK